MGREIQHGSAGPSEAEDPQSPSIAKPGPAKPKPHKLGQRGQDGV